MLFFIHTLLHKGRRDRVFSSTPSIEFIKISPQHVTALQDEVILTVMYRDGNGDIGENSPDVKIFL